MIGPEAEVDIRQLDQAVDGEAAAGEQRQRQRELADDERPAQPMTAAAAGGTARLLQHVVDVRPRGLPRRRAAEEHAGEHRHEQREERTGMFSAGRLRTAVCSAA